MSRMIVLGTGIVGSAAAWDLVGRGHEVVIADVDPGTVERTAADLDVEGKVVDAADLTAIGEVIEGADALISGVPYRHGTDLARTALAAGCHYLDFGGNPTVVAHQLELDDAARRVGVSIIPDCGLAPGFSNVLAAGEIEALGDGPIEAAAMRVGALPPGPVGALGYQLTFSPAGLINEYAEPCEVLREGAVATVEPLTEIETVEWEGWGPLEAFHTAGGSSSLPHRFAGRVRNLDYKTLRFPGHGAIFRALYELGMFSEDPLGASPDSPSPRRMLIDLLERELPRSDDDLVLVRTWATAFRDGSRVTVGHQLEDRHDGRFSALARTTAFPTTALAHLIAADDIEPGARAMEGAVAADALIPELATRGIAVESWRPHSDQPT